MSHTREPRIFKKLVKQVRICQRRDVTKRSVFCRSVYRFHDDQTQICFKTVQIMSRRKYIWVCAQVLLLSYRVKPCPAQFSCSEHFSKLHLRCFKKGYVGCLKIFLPRRGQNATELVID